jgi:arginase
MNLFYPQWQGGGPDLSTYYGAHELKRLYLESASITGVTVSTEDVIEVKRNIYGYEEILRQMTAARRLIDAENPERIFTVGGGCDAGILPLSYLNKTLDGRLTVIWLDAHGDLNLPQTSPSGYFYGMPARTLLGEGEPEILKLLYGALRPEQMIMAGLRDLDAEEIEFIKKKQITLFEVSGLELGLESLLKSVSDRVNNYIYIHLDLDVLDPGQFPHVALPSPGGLKRSTLERLITSLNDQFYLAGLGIFEYSPSWGKRLPLLEQIFRIGLNC